MTIRIAVNNRSLFVYPPMYIVSFAKYYDIPMIDSIMVVFEQFGPIASVITQVYVYTEYRYCLSGKWGDEYLYAILKEEWLRKYDRTA
jgi:hypothetical protein